MLPGLLTDLVALLLLLPVVQNKLTAAAKDYALKNQDKMMQIMAKQMGGQSPFGGMGGSPFGKNGPFGKTGGFGTTVDGEAKPVNPDIKRIKSANDD